MIKKLFVLMMLVVGLSVAACGDDNGSVVQPDSGVIPDGSTSDGGDAGHDGGDAGHDAG
jgi:hypothetical protein